MLFACRPLMEMCIASSLDPTLAPAGCHVASLFTQYTPYHIEGREWTDEDKTSYADRGKLWTRGASEPQGCIPTSSNPQCLTAWRSMLLDSANWCLATTSSLHPTWNACLDSLVE